MHLIVIAETINDSCMRLNITYWGLRISLDLAVHDVGSVSHPKNHLILRGTQNANKPYSMRQGQLLLYIML